MPPFGVAHKLLSGTHPDTSPPAAGADPDDGQVATWSADLGAWIAADAAEGVTDHGLLSGLYPDDDHPQYALADKSSPSPWVAAGDLAGRSLADLGTKAHDLLTGLTDDDHLQYARLLGRAGGQTLYGGAAHGQTLGLVSRLGALSGILKLQEASPQVALTGNLDVSNHLALGAAASTDAERVLNIVENLATNPAVGASISPYGIAVSGAQLIAGLAGFATSRGTPTLALAFGLCYGVMHDSSSPCLEIAGIYANMGSGPSGTGAIATARAIKIPAASWSNAKPAITIGIDLLEQGHADVGTCYGVRISDQTATTVRLLELGPAVPYLRLGGGGNPAANQSHLSLKFGPTLKQLTEYDADSAGVGYRAVRVPN